MCVKVDEVDGTHVASLTRLTDFVGVGLWSFVTQDRENYRMISLSLNRQGRYEFLTCSIWWRVGFSPVSTVSLSYGDVSSECDRQLCLTAMCI